MVCDFWDNVSVVGNSGILRKVGILNRNIRMIYFIHGVTALSKEEKSFESWTDVLEQDAFYVDISHIAPSTR